MTSVDLSGSLFRGQEAELIGSKRLTDSRCDVLLFQVSWKAMEGILRLRKLMTSVTVDLKKALDSITRIVHDSYSDRFSVNFG